MFAILCVPIFYLKHRQHELLTKRNKKKKKTTPRMQKKEEGTNEEEKGNKRNAKQNTYLGEKFKKKKFKVKVLAEQKKLINYN